MVDANSGAAPQPGGYAGPGSEVRGHAVPQAETAGIEKAAVEESEMVPLEEVVEEINGPRPVDPQASAADANEDADGGDADGEGDGDDDAPEDYSDEEVWTHQALKDEIDKRNEGKEDDDHISKGGSSDELRARLVEDDAAQADGGDE